MVLEKFAKYLLNALAVTSVFVNVILFSITAEGSESQIIFRDFSFLTSFQVIFRSLVFL